MIDAENMVETGQVYDVNRIRQDFPILDIEVNGSPLVYLDNAASSHKPKAVSDALVNYYANEHSNVHRGVHTLSQVATDKFEESRQKVRAFINAKDTAEIIFTKGTTDSVNLVATTFAQDFLNEGDEVIISAMEHHSNLVPWQMACERSGATLKVIPINENGELVMSEFESLLGPNTKMVAVVHVSNSLGTINPVEDIIRLAHAQNVPVLIDGAQAAAHEVIDVQKLDCDFYAFSAHKMYGPTGIGVLYGKYEWLDKLPPYQGGGEMIDTVTLEKTTYAKPPFKFEAGTPNIADTIAFGAAINYLEEIGFENIASWEHELLEYATAQLTAIEGIRVIGTAQKKSAIISFNVEGIHHYDLGTILDQQGIAVRTGHHCTQPIMDRFDIPGTVRVSFGMYNTKQEIDTFIAALNRAIGMLK